MTKQHEQGTVFKCTEQRSSIHTKKKTGRLSYDTYFLLLFYSKPDLAENARQGLNKLLADEVPIEIKPVNPPLFYGRAAAEPKKLFWVRARGYIGKMQ